MKIRLGFVSNSSSSSFVILKVKLTDEQLDAIHDHIEYALEHLSVAMACCPGDREWKWHIEEDDVVIRGSTWLDNFCMGDFLELIGVADADIRWSD